MNDDTDLINGIVTTFHRLRGWGEHTDPRLRDLDRAELPLLVVAAVGEVGARLTAAIARLEDAVRALQGAETEDEADQERQA